MGQFVKLGHEATTRSIIVTRISDIVLCCTMN